MREFLYVDDLSFTAKIIETNPKQNLINIGSGSEISIKDLASLLKEITSYKGELIFDTNKPDGNPRKLLDSEIINSLDWVSKYSLRQGVGLTYDWYLKAIEILGLSQVGLKRFFSIKTFSCSASNKSLSTIMLTRLDIEFFSSQPSSFFAFE